MRWFLILLGVLLLPSTALAFEPVNCEKVRDPKSCVACNVYHEARGEPLVGKLAVGIVTLNRVISDLYPDKFCTVVWQKTWVKSRETWVAQFSWTVDGRTDMVYEPKAWQESLNVAEAIVDRYRAGYKLAIANTDINSEVLWYHNTSVSPRWSKVKRRRATLGDHHFYSK